MLDKALKIDPLDDLLNNKTVAISKLTALF
jgi:hypothetical protein